MPRAEPPAEQPPLPRLATASATAVVCAQCPPPKPGRRPRPVRRYGRADLCATHAPPLCIDCHPPGQPHPARLSGVRPAPHPGPRCATHHRARTRAARAADHDRRVVTLYNLTPGEYGRLIEFTGGRDPICQRAKGISKRLGVDHDHATGAPRGPLCTSCNDTLGHLRDDPEAVLRLLAYLLDPPVARLRRGEPTPLLALTLTLDPATGHPQLTIGGGR
jgi:hypothetical protein